MTGQAKRPGEFELIARYFAPLAAKVPGALNLTDDVCTIQPPEGSELVLTNDALTAGIHFLRDDPPDLIARKMLRVNLSDLAAKGARPLGYLMTIALDPEVDEAWLAAFARGLAEDQREFGIDLWGGDTTGTPGPLALTVTMIGSVPTGRAVRRNGARVGDHVLVSGTIGDGHFGLAAHRGEYAGLGIDAHRWLAQRYVVPQPRVGLGIALAEQDLLHAGMDVSDGLAADLGHMCRASACGARIDSARVPLSEPVADLVAEDFTLLPSALTGGDDYELLLAVPADRVEEAKRVANLAGTPLTDIGTFTAAQDVVLLDRDGAPLAIDRLGFTHF